MTETPVEATKKVVVPTQVKYPWRTTLRTTVWYVVTLLAVIPLAAPIVRDELGPYLGDRVVGIIMWTAGVSTAVLAVVQRVVLLTPVASLLARIGLGTGASLEHMLDEIPDKVIENNPDPVVVQLPESSSEEVIPASDSSSTAEGDGMNLS